MILAVASILTACADGTAPSAVDQSGPHFLRWAPTSAPQFEAVGAAAQGSAFVGGSPLFSLMGSSAPVAVDQASSATANASTLRWSHTVGTGTNRHLLVGVSIRGAKNTVTGVTYAGRALAFQGAQNNHDDAVRVEMWSLNAPPSGTATVSVTLSGGAKAVGGAVSFTGVDPVAPLGAFTAVGGTDNTVNPAVALGTSVGDGMAMAVVSLEGSAGTLTPASGQTSQYARFYGTSGGDAAGAASTVSSASSVTMAWTKSGKAKWAIGAAVLNRAPVLAPAVDRYTASFWAKRGQSRSLQINYVSDGGSSPFLRFVASDPTYVPGRGTLAVGDSVLITVTVDSLMVAAHFEPSGMQFGTPSTLTFWYGGVGGDLNGDGLVNATDANIETQLLGMWYQATPTSPWTPIASTRSLTEKWFSIPVVHFSGYAVSW
jgi:hypothetical protein